MVYSFSGVQCMYESAGRKKWYSGKTLVRLSLFFYSEYLVGFSVLNKQISLYWVRKKAINQIKSNHLVTALISNLQIFLTVFRERSGREMKLAKLMQSKDQLTLSLNVNSYKFKRVFFFNKEKKITFVHSFSCFWVHIKKQDVTWELSHVLKYFHKTSA